MEMETVYSAALERAAAVAQQIRIAPERKPGTVSKPHGRNGRFALVGDLLKRSGTFWMLGDIAAATGVSKQSVSKALFLLIRSRKVAREDDSLGGGSRNKPQRYRWRA
jgi:hypothetical protein